MGSNQSNVCVMLAQGCHIKQRDLDFCNNLVVENKKTFTITNGIVHYNGILHYNVFSIYIITEKVVLDKVAMY